MTMRRCSRARRWMRCCARWACRPSTSRRGPRSGPGCTGRCWRRSAEPVLVIADNASSEAQVRPLLPGPGPHRVIVTSRHTLAGLGARLLDVTVLDEEAAVALLDEALRAARPDDDRISADRRGAGRLAGVCGGLPLALQITAALLEADPALTASGPGRRARRRGRGGWRRCAMTMAAGPARRQWRRRSSCPTGSWMRTAARVFRLLPVNPGPDVSTAAAAALAGWPVGEARRVIGRLVRAHLVEAAAGGGPVADA